MDPKRPRPTPKDCETPPGYEVHWYDCHRCDERVYYHVRNIWHTAAIRDES